jgi:hypothetical protein
MLRSKEVFRYTDVSFHWVAILLADQKKSRTAESSLYCVQQDLGDVALELEFIIWITSIVRLTPRVVRLAEEEDLKDCWLLLVLI